MSKAQLQFAKSIKGEKSITQCLEETIKTYGYPFFFNFHFGLHLSMQTLNMKKMEYGSLSFIGAGDQFLFQLAPAYLIMVPTDKPDNYVNGLKVCYEIRQARTKEILGWLCWE